MRTWLPNTVTVPLSVQTQAVLESLQRDGESFFGEILTGTSLTSRNLRDALRGLVGAGLVTNDSMESLRLVVRWRPWFRRAIARRRIHSLAAERLHAVGRSLHRAATAESAAPSKVEAP